MKNQNIHQGETARRHWLRSFSLLFILGFLFTTGLHAQDTTAKANAGGGAGDATAGKALFMQHCARCHSPALDKDMTGPALFGVTGRVPNREWLYQWIPNSGLVIESGDPYAKKLYAKWNSKMDPMPVSRTEIDNILAFIEGWTPPAAVAGTPGGTPAGEDPQISSKWNWILFLIFVVVMLMGGIAMQVARLRGVEFLGGVNLDKLNGRIFMAFYIFGIIGSIYCTGLFKDFYLLMNPASEHGSAIDFMFWLTMAVVLTVFVLTNGLLMWFAYRYSRDENRKARYYPENHKLELIWTVVPAIVLTALVIFGVRTWTKITARPDLANMKTLWNSGKTVMAEGEEKPYIRIEVSGQQFGWTIRYPGMDEKFGDINLHLISGSNELGVRLDQDSAKDDFISDSLVLPKGVLVDLKIRSRDVIHSVYLPHFRVKMDAVPGMDTRFHFTPTQTTQEFRKWLSEKEYYQEVDPMSVETGKEKKRYETFDYELACTEVCGKGHFSMRKTVVVMEIPDFIKWYKSAAARKNILANSKPAAAPTGGTETAAPAPVNH